MNQPMTPQFLTPKRLVEARNLFPFLSTGRMYLNHAATSPLSTRVVAAMEQHLAARSADVVDTFHTDLEMADRLRELVARMINAESPARIAFALNTTDAINVVATGIPWRRGDRIILNKAEFPANVHPYLHAKNFGATIDWLEALNGVVTPENVQRLLVPQTRVVALSAVQFLSGYKADLAAIGALCRSRGVLFIVDGIQAVGATPVDVQSMKIDAMSAGAQKWQMGPHGTGFLYITEELQNRLRQQYVGWLGVKEPWDFFNFEQPLHPTAKRYEGGTLNFPGLWGMHASISTLLEFGIDNIERHLLALTDKLIGALDEIHQFELISPQDYSNRAGIVTVRAANGVNTKTVFDQLQSRQINISLREGLLRFSPHFYNSPDEIGRAADTIRQITKS